MEAPIAVRTQNLNFPFKALDVINILIGPAIGIAKINPAVKPMNKTVIILSNILYCNLENANV